MDSIPKNPLLEFHPDTLQAIRKIYDLDKPGRMNEAIDILDSWVRKQDHFLKKDFDRSYLERTIISTKGSLERAKKQLDKRCTMKTLLPLYFEIHNPKNEFQDFFNVIINLYLPKLTKDFYRVYLLRTDGKGIKSVLFKSYIYMIMMSEYLKSHDYSNGIIMMMDYRDTNIMEIVSSIPLTELRAITSIVIDGYGYRIKGIHIISKSKVIDSLVSLFKQVLSSKLAKRIHIHPTLEEVYEYIPKDILPVEYGGMEKSIMEIHKDWVEVLSSTENLEYMRAMFKAGTDESLRSKEAFNDQYLGMPGTFRTLSVD